MDGLPLQGIKVLDASTVLAAPVCATMLGDFGAEVIKVEQPNVGDFTRRDAEVMGARSLQWVQEARNKKSITIDLHQREGRELLGELVRRVDVFITNFRPPTLEKWDLMPDDVMALNERVVALYITGYGLTGPYHDRGAFDRIASAFAGLTYVSGEREGEPVRTGYALVDYMTAYLGAYSVMLALWDRETKSGKGQAIDLALYEAGFRASEDALQRFSANGAVRGRSGNTNPKVVPANDFVTKDGRRIAVHAGTDALFERLVRAIGMEELASDPAYCTHHGRVRNQEALYSRLAEWFSLHELAEVSALLVENDVPMAPVMNIADIAGDPHYRERGTIVECDDADHGRLLMTAPLPRLTRTPGSVRSLGPVLGADNEEIFGGLLGLSEADLGGLRERGVV